MKKIITIIMFFSSALISCRKETIKYGCDQPQAIISDWLKMDFNPVFSSSTNGILAFQVAHYHINPMISYDSNKYVKLAFAKGSERGHQYYFPMPGLVAIQNIKMDFKISPISFTVTASDALNPNLLPDSSVSENYRFRYILIPKYIYQALKHNWEDYYAVASAFNLSL